MDQLLVLSLVILGLPLLSFVLIIFTQRGLAERAHLIATPILSFALALSLYVAWMKLKGSPAASLEASFTWMRLGNVPGFGPLAISNGVLVDNVTAIMLVVVTLISLLVHLFSSEYMKGDLRYARYYAFLGLFTFSMLGIVLSNNLLALFMCWELVGFSSYVLIAHWYERPGPQYASKKAFIVNRVGDAFMWIGILLLFAEFHTFSFKELFAYIEQGLPLSFSFLGFSPETTLTIAGILIYAGAVGKSAQFPLHVWLPDAMEGPTPVSALIHAATMVAAGVYLTARIFPILTGDAMLVVACTGAFTSFFAAGIAITQNDIKRILAYSTVSQLGLMILSIGSGAVASGLFHLVTHAAFKACLFLGAGSVIHSMHSALHATHDHATDAQDVRNMGGLLKRMPITGWTFIFAALALSGIPLLSGFLSKDEILAGVSAYGDKQQGIAAALPYIGFVVTAMTGFYMWRQVFLVFFGAPRKLDLASEMHESPRMMTVPLVILAALSLWIVYSPNPMNANAGWFLKKWVHTPAQVIPPQTAPRFTSLPHVRLDSTAYESFGYSVIPLGTDPTLQPSEPMPHQLALQQQAKNNGAFTMSIALGASILGMLLAWILYVWKYGLASRFARGLGPVYRLVLNRFYVDELYDYVFGGTFLFASRAADWFDSRLLDPAVNATASITVLVSRLAAGFDRFVVDGVVGLLGGLTQFFGLIVRSFQTGRVQTYMAWAIAGLVVLFVVARYI